MVMVSVMSAISVPGLTMLSTLTLTAFRTVAITAPPTRIRLSSIVMLMVSAMPAIFVPVSMITSMAMPMAYRMAATIVRPLRIRYRRIPTLTASATPATTARRPPTRPRQILTLMVSGTPATSVPALTTTSTPTPMAYPTAATIAH